MLIDSMRRHLMQADSLNIDAHLKHIRQQRAKLVQTLVLFFSISIPSFCLQETLTVMTANRITGSE